MKRDHRMKLDLDFDRPAGTSKPSSLGILSCITIEVLREIKKNNGGICLEVKVSQD